MIGEAKWANTDSGFSSDLWPVDYIFFFPPKDFNLSILLDRSLSKHILLNYAFIR